MTRLPATHVGSQFITPGLLTCCILLSFRNVPHVFDRSYVVDVIFTIKLNKAILRTVFKVFREIMIILRPWVMILNTIVDQVFLATRVLDPARIPHHPPLFAQFF
jgi:hypothetical protein